MNEAVAEFSPSTIGMARCDQCARAIDVMRRSDNEEGRRHKTRGCGADPLRPALVQHRWRWCDEYRPRIKRQ